ncbi:class D beta-lactamase [Massilia sp. Dwa41.01b]|uniref:class D beta-lactamase n=1 Tax=unclassified Massilia TaxID=2609279 RepID=UPI001602EEE3|nr:MULTISPECIES: class D beta-lactamase [unclassified Massilia]QNA88404.1 class D beta-lactamase [Massilia sp. Dwa41.01b]QNA99299.1 class D beta-lactamase [Massilia sp. Se16.2.3]
MRRFLLPLLLSACTLTQAAEWKDSPQVARLFAQEGVKGTFIVHDVAADSYTVHDRQRAQTRYIPASTFKIANSLIGLSTSVVANVDTVLPYGSGPTRRPEWAHDMSLRDAIRISNVPVYQGMARRIGLERMRAGLRTLEYGNMDPGQSVDTFWLDGPLAISAQEQTVFLDRLAQDKLAVPKEAMAAVRYILRQEGREELYAKTGWGSPPGATVDIGWWVGWVKKDGKLYTFALNVDIPDNETGAKRVSLGKAALTALGLL